jgi:hypothetical protein
VLFGATTQFLPFDEVRTWELITESVKSANSAEKFTGEKTSIFSMPMSMKAGMTFESISEDGFGIMPVMRLLAGRDLNRGLDVAKSFKRGRPARGRDSRDCERDPREAARPKPGALVEEVSTVTR